MPDESNPRTRSAFYQPNGEPLHPLDSVTSFGCRLGIVDALSADSITNAPHKVVNALGELAADFDAMEASLEDWFRIHAGPSLTGPLVPPGQEGGAA